MKTTIEISDPVLNEARKLAAREGVTVRALVELGLRRLIAEKKRTAEFRLRPASFNGNGLKPELRGASWERIRELAYEEHGG
ncbi:MAG: type II toxin-antitoxin system VapB family antitoxin [Gammaproteobacteria bacterium]